MKTSLPPHLSHVLCRDGGPRYAVFLLGGGPGESAAPGLGLPAVSDFDLHAICASHRLYKCARNCLQEGGPVSDRIW